MYFVNETYFCSPSLSLIQWRTVCLSEGHGHRKQEPKSNASWIGALRAFAKRADVTQLQVCRSLCYWGCVLLIGSSLNKVVDYRNTGSLVFGNGSRTLPSIPRVKFCRSNLHLTPILSHLSVQTSLIVISECFSLKRISFFKQSGISRHHIYPYFITVHACSEIWSVYEPHLSWVL